MLARNLKSLDFCSDLTLGLEEWLALRGDVHYIDDLIKERPEFDMIGCNEAIAAAAAPSQGVRIVCK